MKRSVTLAVQTNGSATWSLHPQQTVNMLEGKGGEAGVSTCPPAECCSRGFALKDIKLLITSRAPCDKQTSLCVHHTCLMHEGALSC